MASHAHKCRIFTTRILENGERVLKCSGCGHTISVRKSKPEETTKEKKKKQKPKPKRRWGIAAEINLFGVRV